LSSVWIKKIYYLPVLGQKSVIYFAFIVKIAIFNYFISAYMNYRSGGIRLMKGKKRFAALSYVSRRARRVQFYLPLYWFFIPLFLYLKIIF